MIKKKIGIGIFCFGDDYYFKGTLEKIQHILNYGFSCFILTDEPDYFENYLEEEYKKTRGWGHSVYKDAVNLALDAGVKKLGLFHHNQERFDTEIDEIVNDCQEEITRRGKKMECFAVGQSMEIKL